MGDLPQESMARTRKQVSEAEAAFLAEYDVAAFERPSVTVDVTLLTVRDGRLSTWLVRRSEHPHRGRWALPGGFVGMREGLIDAATRVLRDKSGVTGVALEQLHAFGQPDRDPRTRVISVGHFALVESSLLPELTSPRKDVGLFDIEVPWDGEIGDRVDVRKNASTRLDLAFDHAMQIGMAIARLRAGVARGTSAFRLLPERFTMRQLQSVHETVMGTTINKDSFRRRMLATGDLEATGEFEDRVGHRPAELYAPSGRIP